MKTLLILGILLTLTGATLASSMGVSGTWMFQTGLIFLFGALAVSRKEKIWARSGLLFMVALFLWGFVNGMWYAHPLGAIISIVGGGWVAYRLVRDGRNEVGVSLFPFPQIQKLFQKLIPNIKQNNILVVIGVVILAIILFFAFSNKPNIEQRENSRDIKKANITNLLSWKEFISPDNQFKILFPGNPKYETEKPSDDKTSSIIQYDFYTYKLNEGVAYFVNSAIFSSAIDFSDTEAALKGFLNEELASNQEYELISSNITSFNGYTALDFFVEDKTSKYKGRDIILGNIRYQLMVVYNDENFNQNDYHKFINSFTFLTSKDKIGAQIKKFLLQRLFREKNYGKSTFHL